MLHGRPVALVAVLVLVGVEVVACAVVAVAVLVGMVRGSSLMPGASAFLATFFLAVAAVLALAARGLWSGRRWGRAPVMTWQVLLVVLAWGWLRVEVSVLPALVLTVAAVTGVGLLVPSVVRATTGSSSSEPAVDLNADA